MESFSSNPTYLREETNSETPFKLGYRAELDGFRGISILLVFIHHAYHTALPGGFLGVDVFFVLSGFLITSLLYEEWQKYGNISLKNFYIRRGFRLMPAVFLVIALLCGYAVFFTDTQTASKTYEGSWLTLTYLSNWFYALSFASADNPLGVTWSLAIEEQFYLIYPIVLLFLLGLKLGKRQIIYAFILAILGIAFYRKYLFEQYTILTRMYYATDTRADGLLVGCFAAFIAAWRVPEKIKNRAFLYVGAVASLIFLCFMFATATWSDPFLYQRGGYTLVAAAVAILILVIVAYQPKIYLKILRFSPLVWVGRVSYGLYLWHWCVRYFVYEGQSLPSSNTKLAIMVVLSFTFTTLSFYCIEKPFLRLKDRFGHR